MAESCEKCGVINVDQTLKVTFRVLVCSRCRDVYKDEFDLLSKSRAKEEYLVSDGDLSNLKRLSKPNPKSPDFRPMQLFLQRQVVEKSLKKWNSIEALEAEKRRRKDKILAAGPSLGRRRRGIAPENALEAERERRINKQAKIIEANLKKRDGARKEGCLHEFHAIDSAANHDDGEDVEYQECKLCGVKRTIETL